jgi:hypothetical protein
MQRGEICDRLAVCAVQPLYNSVWRLQVRAEAPVRLLGYLKDFIGPTAESLDTPQKRPYHLGLP